MSPDCILPYKFFSLSLFAHEVRMFCYGKLLYIEKKTLYIKKIYLFYGKKLYLNLFTLVEGDSKAPFSKVTTPRC